MTALVFRCQLPPRVLSPNSEERHSWRRVAIAKREYLNGVYLQAVDARNRAGWEMPGRVRVSLEFQVARGPVYPDGLYRPEDVGNCVSAWKAGFDAIVQAELFLDDDSGHMELGAVTIDKGAGPGVRVTVEALERKQS